MEDLIRLTAGPSVTVEFALDNDIPAFLGSARELENVILNLVVNARDAMPAGGVIRVSTFPDSRSTAGARDAAAGIPNPVLRVTDTGSACHRRLQRRSSGPSSRPSSMERGPDWGWLW
jgi:signal transduction histidine kinase